MIFKSIKNLFRNKKKFRKDESELVAMFVKDYFIPIDFKNFDRKVKITKIFKLNSDINSTCYSSIIQQSKILCNYGHKSNQIKKTFIIPPRYLR
jgi:hypothetical protein